MKKNDIKNRSLPLIEVIDLFCGIGGLSFGMKSKGFDILAGYDLDATCRYAYETNNEAKFIYKDIITVSADETGFIQILSYFNPFVIIDESHNFEANLRVDMLKTINPCFILDLTQLRVKRAISSVLSTQSNLNGKIW